MEYRIVISGFDDSEQYRSISEDIIECENITTSLVDELAEIDSSIEEFKESFYDTARSLGDFACGITDGINEKNADKHLGEAALGVGAMAAAAVVGTVGFVAGKIKEKKARKVYEEKMEALLITKQQVAEEKLDSVEKTLQRMKSSLFERTEKLYENEFSKCVSNDDELLQSKILVFQKSLGIVLKTRYLSGSLNYVIAEMKAWKKGMHDTTYTPPSIPDLFNKELNSWPGKFKRKTLLAAFEDELQTKEKTVRVPLAFIAANPIMLETYIGINLPMINDNTETCIFAKIDENSWKMVDDKLYAVGNIPLPDGALGPIVKGNPYFQKCEGIMREEYHFPKSPDGFGSWDIIYIVFVSLIFLAAGALLCSIGSSTFLHIFFCIILPYLVVFIIETKEYDFEFSNFWECLSRFEDLFEFLHKHMPYYRRKQKFEKNLNEDIERIASEKENVNDIDDELTL